MKIKTWKRDCLVDADIEIFYKGSCVTGFMVNRLKVTEVGKRKTNKDGHLSKGGFQENLAVEPTA